MILWGCGLLGTLSGAFLGVVQGWVLRRALLGEMWLGWVPINLLGLIVAAVIFLGASLVMPGSGLWLPGLLLGFAQWIVPLRRYVANAGW